MLGGMGAAFLRERSQSAQATGVVWWGWLGSEMGFVEQMWRGLVLMPQFWTIWSVASLTLEKHKPQDLL